MKTKEREEANKKAHENESLWSSQDYKRSGHMYTYRIDVMLLGSHAMKRFYAKVYRSDDEGHSYLYSTRRYNTEIPCIAAAIADLVGLPTYRGR